MNRTFLPQLIGSLFIIALIGISFYLFSHSSQEVSSSQLNQPFLIPEGITQDNIPSGWKKYENKQYSFSLWHPQDQVVKEFDEGQGAATITFENSATVEGFQIFVVPYLGIQIDEARFKQDVPSGVRENLASLSIDGVEGAVFDSRNDMWGDTREVWFISKGYLYEVSTFKHLAPLVEGVIKTWKFDDKNN